MRVVFVFGTRPEAIKLAPLIREFLINKIDVKICVTAQHREMLDQVLRFFQINPDYDLNLMKKNQSLFDVTSDILKNLEPILKKEKPNLLFVQGDTTTAFAGALSSFYLKIPIAHIEAGLRSFNKYSPFPEEINRVLLGHLADYHFAPTERAKKNLLNEGIKENIWVVGNTVIDALHLGSTIIEKDKNLKRQIEDYFNSKLKIQNSKLILMTGHRRESFGIPFENICLALKEIVNQHKDVEIVYPVHLNPRVREPVKRILGNEKRVHLIEPLEYPYMVWLMSKCFLVLTDSGGIQEEAPSLGKPILVLRDVTEREEGIEAGTAKLVGTDKEKIIEETNKLLGDSNEYRKMAKAINPYGDGKTSERVFKIIKEVFK